MTIVSQREKQRAAVKQHLISKGKNHMSTDQERVNAALLGAVSISEEEQEELLATELEDDHEDFEDFEGDDQEVDDEDFGDDEDDEDEDFGDDEDEDDDDEDEDEDDILDDEDDEDPEMDSALGVLAAAIGGNPLILDADDVELSEIVEQTSLAGLAELSGAEAAEITTTSVDSAVLITIDASNLGKFDEFKRKALSNVVLDGNETPVNLFATLSSKKGGYLVAPIEEVLTYHSVLAESGSAVLIADSETTNDSITFMEAAINRSTSMLSNDALGVDADNPDSTFLIMTDEMAEAYNEEDDSELNLDEFENSMLTVDDFINVSSFVTSQDVEDEAIAAATVHTHIAVRFPALSHQSTVSKDSVAKIVSQIPKLIARFQSKHPSVALRFGVTMKSTDVLRTELGKQISEQLMEMNLQPRSYSDVCFTDDVFPFQGDTFDTSPANSVFHFGGDLLYIADYSLPEEDEE